MPKSKIRVCFHEVLCQHIKSEDGARDSAPLAIARRRCFANTSSPSMVPETVLLWPSLAEAETRGCWGGNEKSDSDRASFCTM
eukprot:15479140-Alexandrium_andersonii.AAC.1